jgi:hypothetical protein
MWTDNARIKMSMRSGRKLEILGGEEGYLYPILRIQIRSPRRHTFQNHQGCAGNGYPIRLRASLNFVLAQQVGLTTAQPYLTFV